LRPKLLAVAAAALAGVALTFACGGTTSSSLPATPDAPAQAGTGGAPASKGGSGGSLADPLQESAAGASTVQPLCDAAIDAAALRGCRTPSEPGCQSCYRDFGGGTCSLFTGNLARGDWAYNFVGQVECDSDLPRCASCTRGEEFQVCNTVDRPECDCSVVDLIDPCITPQGCDCFCVTSGRLACPRPH
jgi:hypothetical protein